MSSPRQFQDFNVDRAFNSSGLPGSSAIDNSLFKATKKVKDNDDPSKLKYQAEHFLKRISRSPFARPYSAHVSFDEAQDYAKQEAKAQEFFRLLIPRQPKGRVVLDEQQKTVYLDSKAIPGFIPLCKDEELANSKLSYAYYGTANGWSGLGELYFLSAYIRNADFKSHNIGHSNNQVYSIDFGRCFADFQQDSLISRKIRELTNRYQSPWSFRFYSTIPDEIGVSDTIFLQVGADELTYVVFNEDTWDHAQHPFSHATAGHKKTITKAELIQEIGEERTKELFETPGKEGLDGLEKYKTDILKITARHGDTPINHHVFLKEMHQARLRLSVLPDNLFANFIQDNRDGLRNVDSMGYEFEEYVLSAQAQSNLDDYKSYLQQLKIIGKNFLLAHFPRALEEIDANFIELRNKIIKKREQVAFLNTVKETGLGQKHKTFKDFIDRLKEEFRVLSTTDQAVGAQVIQALESGEKNLFLGNMQQKTSAATTCLQAISQAHSHFQATNKRSTANLLANAALFIFSGFLPYLIVAGLHYMQTGRFTFFHKASCANKLSQFSQEFKAQFANELSTEEPLPTFKAWSSIRF